MLPSPALTNAGDEFEEQQPEEQQYWLDFDTITYDQRHRLFDELCWGYHFRLNTTELPEYQLAAAVREEGEERPPFGSDFDNFIVNFDGTVAPLSPEPDDHINWEDKEVQTLLVADQTTEDLELLTANLPDDFWVDDIANDDEHGTGPSYELELVSVDAEGDVQGSFQA